MCYLQFYEELNAEEIAKLTVGEEPSNLWKPPTVPQPPQALQPSTATEISDYYSVIFSRKFSLKINIFSYIPAYTIEILDFIIFFFYSYVIIGSLN